MFSADAASHAVLPCAIMVSSWCTTDAAYYQATPTVMCMRQHRVIGLQYFEAPLSGTCWYAGQFCASMLLADSSPVVCDAA